MPTRVAVLLLAATMLMACDDEDAPKKGSPPTEGPAAHVAGTASHEALIEQLRSSDPDVRRKAVEALRREGDPCERALRSALVDVNRSGAVLALPPALAMDPELSGPLLGDRLGYLSVLNRIRVLAGLADPQVADPYVIAILVVHAVLDASRQAREAAGTSLGRLVPTLRGAVPQLQGTKHLDAARLFEALRELPQLDAAAAAVVAYLHVFESRLGGEASWAGVRLRLAAEVVAARREPGAGDDEWLRELWRDVQPRWRAEGEDRSELAMLVARALRWTVAQQAGANGVSDSTPELALWRAIRAGPTSSEDASALRESLVAGATPAMTLWAVRRGHTHAIELERSLRMLACDKEAPPPARLRAAKQLAAFARLGDVLPFLVAQLSDSGHWRSALRALVLCHREDVAAVREQLESLAGSAGGRRSDRLLYQRMIKRLDYSEAERVWEILGTDDTDLIAALDRWAE